MALFTRRFTDAGAPPGTIVEPTSASPTKLRFIRYSPSSLEEGEVASASDVPRPSDDGVVWYDLRGLGDGSVVEQFRELLGLHPLSVSDVMNLGQRPKVEDYDDVLFVVLRMVTTGAESGQLTWEQVSLFMGPGWVLTIQETHEDCLESIRERIRDGRKKIRGSGSDYLGCMVLDTVVDGYFPVLEAFGERLEALEEQVFEGARGEVLGHLYRMKRDLTGFRRATWPLREALNTLLREEESPLTDLAKLHLRDALDHVMQVVEVSESYRELSASLADVHLSIVGHRTNEIMRVLTVVSAIFIPLTFVAGVYGMNFDRESPWNLPELGWTYGYPVFWGVTAVIFTSLLILFARLGWLRR